VNAALNAVCNGIAVFEFETRVGADRERAAALLDKLAAMLDKMGAGREPGSGCEHGPQRLSHRGQCRRAQGAKPFNQAHTVERSNLIEHDQNLLALEGKRNAEPRGPRPGGHGRDDDGTQVRMLAPVSATSDAAFC
jgi:hypothetical protein